MTPHDSPRLSPTFLNFPQLSSTFLNFPQLSSTFLNFPQLTRLCTNFVLVYFPTLSLILVYKNLLLPFTMAQIMNDSSDLKEPSCFNTLHNNANTFLFRHRQYPHFLVLYTKPHISPSTVGSKVLLGSSK